MTKCSSTGVHTHLSSLHGGPLLLLLVSQQDARRVDTDSVSYSQLNNCNVNIRVFLHRCKGSPSGHTAFQFIEVLAPTDCFQTGTNGRLYGFLRQLRNLLGCLELLEQHTYQRQLEFLREDGIDTTKSIFEFGRNVSDFLGSHPLASTLNRRVQHEGKREASLDSVTDGLSHREVCLLFQLEERNVLRSASHKVTRLSFGQSARLGDTSRVNQTNDLGANHRHLHDGLLKVLKGTQVPKVLLNVGAAIGFTVQTNHANRNVRAGVHRV